MSVSSPLLVFLAVISALLVSMAVYVQRGPTRDADQRGKGGQLFGGSGDFLLH